MFRLDADTSVQTLKLCLYQVKVGCTLCQDIVRPMKYTCITSISSHPFCAGLNWRKLAPVPILALVTEYCELPNEQVVVLFQILAAEINFGYKFQTVKCALSSCLLLLCMHSQELQLHTLL